MSRVPYTSLLALLVLGPALTGCHTLPLPESHTRKNTYDIVQALRCEVAFGIFTAVKDGLLNGSELEQLEVGFDFEFDVTQRDHAKDGKLELTHLLTGGSLKLAFGGGYELERQNVRSFRLLETFKAINDSVDQGRKCPQKGDANYSFPVTGRVGLEEIVLTFSRLKKLSTINQRGSADDTLISDKVTFTTTVSAGLTPTLTIEAAGGPGLRTTAASIVAGASRIDKHIVTIALSPGPPPPAKRKIKRVVRKNAKGQMEVFTTIERSAPRTSQPSRVVDELDRLKRQSDDKRILIETLRLLR